MAVNLVLLTEYAFDSRNSLSHSGFQNDLTMGACWLKNDIDDTEVAALLTQDLDYKAQLITIRMDRRINDSVTFKTSVCVSHQAFIVTLTIQCWRKMQPLLPR